MTLSTVVAVKSPCKGICRMNTDNHVCVGCYRTAQEKIRWGIMTNQEKMETLGLVALRKEKLGKFDEAKDGAYFYHPPEC